MNIAIITGRTTKDFEAYTSKNGMSIAKNNIAVDSGFGENKRTDFIPITAFGKTADFCTQYVSKGDLIEVRGHIVTGSYKKQDGTVVYTTDVNVDELKKLQGKKIETKEEAEPLPDFVPKGFEQVEADIPF